ncbi:unnamed protein product [Mytilus coruscus]|uniref:Reverse transcriptase domain-containing protein n=1 Tax=Mytilus coruscus TaxID=42192 RepID=A0A6J8CU59_MYTCO|nr:unnamed protein product [Mytilus coruscus]
MNNKIPRFSTSTNTRKRLKMNKPFWNDELRILWNDMHTKENQFLIFKGKASVKSQLRKDFKSSQTIFDRKLRKCERQHRQSFCIDIDIMTTNNRNAFWEKIKSVLEKWKSDFEHLYNNDQSEEDFNSEFYRYALSHKTVFEDIMFDPLYNDNEELNGSITIKEIETVTKSAKNGKSTGIDQIPYEVLIFPNVFQVIRSLFQLIFDTSCIPSIWRKAVIFPISKDPLSDNRILLNYRGISLLSCISRLYSAFINNRLSTFLDENDVLADELNGFRRNRSCEDHVFSLSSVIRNNANVITTFVDLKEAFDFVDRDMLLYKLLLNNIDGKMYNSIKNIYSYTTASIHVNQKMSDWFVCNSGIKQGDNCSSTLFSIFINDLVQEVNN